MIYAGTSTILSTGHQKHNFHLRSGHIIQHVRVIDIIFISAFLFSFLVPFIRDLGGAYSLASEWETTRFAFSTTMGRYAALLDYVQCVLFLLLLLKYVLSHKNDMLLTSILSIGGFIIYTIIEIIGKHVEIFDALFGSVPTTVFLLPMFSLLGNDINLYGIIQKYVKTFAIVSLSLCFLSIIRFHIQCGWGSTVGWCPARDYFALAICFMWILVTCSKKIKYSEITILCLFMTIIAFMISVRSWVLQTIIILLYTTLVKSDGMSRSKKIILFICGIIFVLSIITSIMPSVFQTFTDRLSQDTRSGQYETFFSQISASSLVLGKGSEAGYLYGTNSNYLFFDNQFIFLMFHFGLIPICVLGVILGKAFLSGARSASFNEKGRLFCAVVYAAALFGLSTYFPYTVNAGTVALFMRLGHSDAEGKIFVTKNGIHELECDK